MSGVRRVLAGTLTSVVVLVVIGIAGVVIVASGTRAGYILIAVTGGGAVGLVIRARRSSRST